MPIRRSGSTKQIPMEIKLLINSFLTPERGLFFLYAEYMMNGENTRLPLR